MINQKPISARIDYNTLWELEQEAMISGTTRNRALNKGARLWLDLNDRRRQMRAHPDPEIRRKIVRGFIDLWIPEATGLGF